MSGAACSRSLRHALQSAFGVLCCVFSRVGPVHVGSYWQTFPANSPWCLLESDTQSGSQQIAAASRAAARTRRMRVFSAFVAFLRALGQCMQAVASNFPRLTPPWAFLQHGGRSGAQQLSATRPENAFPVLRLSAVIAAFSRVPGQCM